MLHGINDSLLFGINALIINLKIGRNSNLIVSNKKEEIIKNLLTYELLDKVYLTKKEEKSIF